MIILHAHSPFPEIRKSACKDAKAQRPRKENSLKGNFIFGRSLKNLCVSFASLRLCGRVFLFSLLLLPFSAQSQSGLAFLKIGVGGRAAGLAETYVAAANDPTAIYWNAAGLDRSQGTVAVFSHNTWLQGIRADFLALSFPSLGGAVGLGLNMQTIPDIELRTTTPSPEPVGFFDARDLALTVAYSRPLRENIQLGLAVKYLYEKIHVESASGFAVDAGVLVKNLVAGLRVGAALQNLGSISSLQNDKIDLPALARLGFAYSPAQPANGALTLMSDVVILFDGDTGATVAGEYVFQKTLALRAGYQLNRENRGIAGGAGLQWGRYQLDYGYLPFASELGDTHRFSLVLRL
jgi:hypothetical protein